jgi:hypothetical protein
MHNYSCKRHLARFAMGLSVSALALPGCKEAHDVLDADITGRVLDNRGEPVEGATVRLYGLLDNTDFVEGGDIRSAEAYIDREAVLASRDTVATGETDADGRFELGAIPNAFLAVAVKDGCSPSFAGFDEATGVLNFNTLLTPTISGGVDFDIPSFAVACATPPEVSEDGSGPDAPAFDPPVATVSCDTVSCEAAGGTCSSDETTCTLPACDSDADCEAGQPGAFCENPGDVALAACHAPLPAEIIPPPAPQGWTSCRVTDSDDNVLADASSANASVSAAAIPDDRIVRVYGDFDGSATDVYVQVQSGGSSCANFPPRTDYIPVSVLGGQIASDKGSYVELALHGGYQRIQLTTSDTLGVGERSFVVQFGEPCAPPEHAFTAILTWDDGLDPVDLDLSVWNGDGRVLCTGSKQSGWGQLRDGKSPGPEVFWSDDVSQGPFTIKVQFFCGRPRPIAGKVRIIRTLAGQLVDETHAFTVDRPKVVAEIGVFAAQ